MPPDCRVALDGSILVAIQGVVSLDTPPRVLTVSRLFRHPALLFVNWLFIWLCISCEAQAAPQEDWLIVPGVRVGPITAGTAPTELVEMFGEANVQPGEIQQQEGPPRIGTVVYPDEPARRLEIIWQELEDRRTPWRIFIRGDSSAWTTQGGVTLGTTLKELEQVNGGVFGLAGFMWDYSGTVMSWEGGSLASAFTRGDPSGNWDANQRIILSLQPTIPTRPDDAFLAVIGDRRFLSSHSSMHLLNPRVQEIVVSFD